MQIFNLFCKKYYRYKYMGYMFEKVNNLSNSEFLNIDLFLPLKSKKFYTKVKNGLKKRQEIKLFALGYLETFNLFCKMYHIYK